MNELSLYSKKESKKTKPAADDKKNKIKYNNNKEKDATKEEKK